MKINYERIPDERITSHKGDIVRRFNIYEILYGDKFS
jgi:hypothetical protein